MSYRPEDPSLKDFSDLTEKLRNNPANKELQKKLASWHCEQSRLIDMASFHADGTPEYMETKKRCVMLAELAGSFAHPILINEFLTVPAPRTIKDEIADLLMIKSRALLEQSAEALNDIIDDRFVYVNSSGKQFSKAEYIQFFTGPELQFKWQTFRDLDVQQVDDTVVATMTLNDGFIFEGQLHETKFKSTCTFKKVNDRWLWLGGLTKEA